MKKLSLLTVFLLSFSFLFAQYPTQQSLGSDSTIVTSKGGLKGRIINWHYSDTTAANRERISQYPFAQISVGNYIWTRDSTATRWVRGAASSDISDSTQYLKKSDSSTYATKYRLDSIAAAKQNIITNLSDTSKYLKKTDSTIYATVYQNGLKVDEVGTNSDSTALWYRIGTDTVTFYNIKTGLTGGDTTILQTSLDSTGQPGQRVLWSANNKIRSDKYFIYDSLRHKLVIGNTNISVGGTSTKFYVVGNAIINGNLTATKFIKVGGTSAQYLMADGSVTTSAGGGTGGISKLGSPTFGLIKVNDSTYVLDTTNGATSKLRGDSLAAAISANTSSIATKLNITDTTNKWVQTVSLNTGGDSLIVLKNGTRTASKLPSGTAVTDTIHVQNMGAGTKLAYTNGSDTLNVKNIQAGTGITITPNPDSSLTISSTGGGGSTNTSIGTGIKIAVNGTNNIKSLFANVPLSADSTSNTSAVTIKADTTVSTPTALVTQNQLGKKADTSSLMKYLLTGARNNDLFKYDSANNRIINFTLQTTGRIGYNSTTNTLSWDSTGFSSPGAWGTTGNTALSTDFIGTVNNQPLNFEANNTRLGYFNPSDSSFYLGSIPSARDNNFIKFIPQYSGVSASFDRPQILFGSNGTSKYFGMDYDGISLYAGAALKTKSNIIDTGYIYVAAPGSQIGTNSAVSSNLLLLSGYQSGSGANLNIGDGGTTFWKLYRDGLNKFGMSLSARLGMTGGNFIIGPSANWDSYANAIFQVISTTQTSIPSPVMTTSQRNTINTGFKAAAVQVLGSGYTNGTYNGTSLTGGTGSGATANFTVSGGAITVNNINAAGSGYSIGDTLRAPSLPGGSGFYEIISQLTGIIGSSNYNTTDSTIDFFNGKEHSQFGNKIVVPTTIIATGVTGNQTINKINGTVNIAASGTTVTVTNSKVTANSIVQVVLRTNDSTAWIKNCVPASGSFTINLGAAATGEVSIGFTVIN